MPARFKGIWQPHITFTAPWILAYTCLGLAADLAFRRVQAPDAAVLLLMYAAALGAAWFCWPPAFIRGNMAHAAAHATGAIHGLP